MSRLEGVTAKAFKTRQRTLRVSQGTVAIDAYATDQRRCAREFAALARCHKVKVRGPLVSARVPVKSLGQIAALRSQ